jgi:signal transduction histidine kinase
LEPTDIEDNENEAKNFLEFLNSKENIYLNSSVSRPGNQSFTEHKILGKTRNFYTPPTPTVDENIGPKDKKRRRTALFFEKLGEDKALKEAQKLGISPKAVEYFQYPLRIWNTTQVYFKTFRVGTFGDISSVDIVQGKSPPDMFRDKVVLIGAFDEFSLFSKPSIFDLTEQPSVDNFKFSYYPYHDYVANILYLYSSGDYIKNIEFPDILILFTILTFLIFIKVDLKRKILIFLTFIPILAVAQIVAYIASSSYLNFSHSISLVIFIQIFILPILFFSVLKQNERNKMAEVASAKIEALQAISEKLAHDIRSPLSTINLLITKASFANVEQKEILQSAVNRIGEMTEEILLDSRQKNNVTEIVQVISNIVDEKKIIYSNIQFKFNTSEPIFVSISKPDFERIINNILDNSVAAVPEKFGEIVISFEKLQKEMVKILVADNGVGIDRKLLNSLGKVRVVSTKSTGNGVGLYHTKEMIEKNFGKFEIKSEKNQGTLVSILLHSVAR